VLAGQAFVNLSRPPGGHTITVNAKSSGTDAPDEVCALLTGVAANLPHLHPDGRPVADATTSTDYSVPEYVGAVGVSQARAPARPQPGHRRPPSARPGGGS
jgi:hypothetical protein